MILIAVNGAEVTSVSNISSDEKAIRFLSDNPSFQQAPAGFDPHLPLSCYEQVDGVVQLKADWETIRSDELEQRRNRYKTKPRAFDNQSRRIKERVSQLIEAGAPYDATRWPADAESQLAKTAITASIAAGRGMAGGGASVTVRDINRAKFTMNANEYLDMAAAVRDYVLSVRETADTHIDALMAMMGDDTKTFTDVEAYDVTTGWPA